MKKCLKAAAIFSVIFFFTANLAMAQDQKAKSDRTKLGTERKELKKSKS